MILYKMKTYNVDPTGTTTLREEFAAKYRGKYRELERLSVQSLKGFAVFVTPITPNSNVSDNQYMNWYETAQLSILAFSIYGEYWFNHFIDRAYKKGMGDARKDLIKNGIEVEEDFELAFIKINKRKYYNDVLNKILNLAADDRKAIAKILSEKDLLGPEETAKAIRNKISTIGIHRATLIARTEIIRMHHIAKVDQYKEYGVEKMKVDVEWVATNDSRVCELCRPLDGKIFTLKEVEHKIPVHPQCRCTIVMA